MLNSRELAAVIWLGVFIIWAVRIPGVRTSLRGVIRSFLEVKILGPISVYILYIAAWLWLADAFGLWETSLLKETVIWFVITGFPFLLRFDQVGKDERFFRKAILSVIGISAFLEFFMNITTFHLAFELLLLPVLTTLSLMVALADSRTEFKSVKRPLEVALATIGITLLVVTARQNYQQRHELDIDQLWRSLALGIWLPLVILPFLYAFSVYASYETAFLRMESANKRRRPTLSIRMAVVFGLKGRVREVQSFSGVWLGEVSCASSFAEAHRRVQQFRDHLNEQR